MDSPGGLPTSIGLSPCPWKERKRDFQHRHRSSHHCALERLDRTPALPLHNKQTLLLLVALDLYARPTRVKPNLEILAGEDPRLHALPHLLLRVELLLRTLALPVRPALEEHRLPGLGVRRGADQ